MKPYFLKTNNTVKKIVVILHKRYRYQVLINKAKLSESEKPITNNECQKAIYQLANNKSPDLDDFYIKFCKIF